MSKSIDFLTIQIEGFRSFDNFTFDFDQKGITLIKAANGSGKSSIFEALYYVLFGKSLKETNLSELPTWPEYRTKSFQGTRVILEFIIGDKQYVLARHINYKGKTFDLTGNSSVMLKDLTGLDDGLHKSDVQAEIDRLLEISPKTFLNSVLFGQRMTKFIQADNADKATIFSKFFDVDYIDKAKDRATDEADVLKAKISNYTSKIEKNNIKIEMYNSEAERQKELLTNYEIEKKEQIKKLKSQLKELVIKETFTVELLKRNDLLYQEKEKESTALNSIRISNAKIESDNHHNTKSIEKLEKEFNILLNTTYNDVCNKCGNKLTKAQIEINRKEKDDKLISLKLEIAKLKESINKTKKLKDDKLKSILSELTEHEKELKQNRKDYDAYQKIINDNKVIKSKRIAIKKQIADKEVEKLNIKKVNYKIKITELEDLNSVSLKNIKVVESKLQIYNWWISTGFATKGLKSFIIDTMLSHLNQLVDKYAMRLGLKIFFRVELSGKSKKFVTECAKANGIIRNYESFSGGEKTRIDLALCMGIYDLLASFKTKFNILLFDEAFENLDEEGVFDMFELMREKSNTTNLFLVTHNQKLDLINTRTINLTKINEITKYEVA